MIKDLHYFGSRAIITYEWHKIISRFENDRLVFKMTVFSGQTFWPVQPSLFCWETKLYFVVQLWLTERQDASFSTGSFQKRISHTQSLWTRFVCVGAKFCMISVKQSILWFPELKLSVKWSKVGSMCEETHLTRRWPLNSTATALHNKNFTPEIFLSSR